MMPPGLNEGEARFVRDLRDYLQKNNECLKGKEIFLLRNLTRGKGIGFFDTKAGEAFYPDFILWVIEDNEQRIAFIDPHGLRMAQGGFLDPKIRLYEELKQLSGRLSPVDGRTRVYLTSFIISTTPFETASRVFGTDQKEEFYKNHILFQEDRSTYIEELLKALCLIED